MINIKMISIIIISKLCIIRIVSVVLMLIPIIISGRVGPGMGFGS